jgi:hypothetical protein
LDTVGRDAGRLVPQDHRGAVAGLTSEKDRAGDVGPGTPRVTAIMGRGAETRPDGKPVQCRSRCQGRQDCSLDSPQA